MAARRFSPKHDQQTRDKIQTSQLVNRLTSLVKGEVEMAPHAVTAALGLLRKTLPDLASVEHTVDNQHPFAVIPQVLASARAWEQASCPEKLIEGATGQEGDDSTRH